MKFEEYLKNKSILTDGKVNESNNVLTEEQMLIQEHLERIEDDQLYEGVFSSIWKWLKLNFSGTASKIKDYAKEYEDVLNKETDTDHFKASLVSNAKSNKLNSDVMSAFKLQASAIKRKMHAVAKGDKDYDHLVDSLITEIDYRVASKALERISKTSEIKQSPEAIKTVEAAKVEASDKEKEAKEEVLKAVDTLKEKEIETEKTGSVEAITIVKSKFKDALKEKLISSKQVAEIAKGIVTKMYSISSKMDSQSRTIKETIVNDLADVCHTFYVNNKEIGEKDLDILQAISYVLEEDTTTLRISSIKETISKLLKTAYKRITEGVGTYEGYDELNKDIKKIIIDLDNDKKAIYKKFNTEDFKEKVKTEFELEYELILLGLIKGGKIHGKSTNDQVFRKISFIASINSNAFDELDSDEKEYRLLKASYEVLKDEESNEEEDYKLDLFKELSISGINEAVNTATINTHNVVSQIQKTKKEFDIRNKELTDKLEEYEEAIKNIGVDNKKEVSTIDKDNVKVDKTKEDLEKELLYYKEQKSYITTLIEKNKKVFDYKIDYLKTQMSNAREGKAVGSVDNANID